MSKDGLNKKVGYGLLAAFYAPLLTDRQKSLLEMYCDEDLSLSEIADQLSISRQAVSDNLNRAYTKLDDLEGQLRLYNNYRIMLRSAAACRELLKKVRASTDTADYLGQAILLLEEGMAPGDINDGI